MLACPGKSLRNPPVYPDADNQFRPQRAIRSLVWASLCLACLVCMPVRAQDDPGRFEVRTATATLQNGVYYLDGRIEYRLSTDMREALEAGVPLTFRLDVELIRIRRFWPDVTHASLRQRYVLEFHALSERYIVLNLNSGEQVTFATLFSALNHLGRVDELPLIDAALLDDGRRYEVRLRAVLDVERLSGPLRLLAFWRRDWSVASEWYTWQLRHD
jgi:hypothetical protein